MFFFLGSRILNRKRGGEKQNSCVALICRHKFYKIEGLTQLTEFYTQKFFTKDPEPMVQKASDSGSATLLVRVKNRFHNFCGSSYDPENTLSGSTANLKSSGFPDISIVFLQKI